MLQFSEPSILHQHQAWLNMQDTIRPLLTCQIGFLPPTIYPRLWSVLPQGRICPDHIRIDRFLEDIENLFQQHQRLNDDLPFVGVPFVGVPWMEAIMGCPIHATRSSMYAEPVVEAWDTWHWQKPVLAENAWARKLLELMAALNDHAAGRYTLAPTLMRGPADILSAMRGAVRFSLDFYDSREAVQRALSLLADVWIEVGKEQLDMLPSSDNGYVGSSGWRVWAPDKIIWLQEDAMALLSPTLYRDFVLQEDRRILSHFPYTSFHLHASALWAVDMLVRVPELDMLELNYESARLDAAATLAAWARIQRHKPLVAWKEFDGDPFWVWLDEAIGRLLPSGPLFSIVVTDAEQGLMVKDRIASKVR